MKIRIRSLGVTAVVAAVAAAGLQVAAATPAAAVAGLTRVLSAATADNADDKNARAECPSAAPRIVGGGFLINDHSRRLAFARISRPLLRVGPNGRDVWDVSASIPIGFTTPFTLQAIAVCAADLGVPGHEVKHGTVVANAGSTTLNSVAICSSGKRVIGVGGAVFNGGHAVGLSTVRSAGPRDISRSFALDKYGDTDGVWHMQTSAVCMTTSDTREATFVAQSGTTATVRCSDSPNLPAHGPGGGSWTGTGLLHRIEVSADLKLTTVQVTPGSTATLASTICLP